MTSGTPRQLLSKPRQLLKKLLSYLPSKLPTGKTQFDAFAADLIALSDFQVDETSMRFAIASMLIHAPSDSGSLSKNYFVKRLRKSAANQVASQVFQDIKAAQDATQTAGKQPEPAATSPQETTTKSAQQ